jgi:hypothetical protein
VLYCIEPAVYVLQADAVVRSISGSRDIDGYVNSYVTAKRGGRVI